MGNAPSQDNITNEIELQCVSDVIDLTNDSLPTGEIKNEQNGMDIDLVPEVQTVNEHKNDQSEKQMLNQNNTSKDLTDDSPVLLQLQSNVDQIDEQNENQSKNANNSNVLSITTSTNGKRLSNKIAKPENYLRIQHGEKQYQCLVCDKKFNYKKSLKGH